MRLQPALGRKRIFGLFRAEGTCLQAENVVLTPANRSTNPFTRFERLLQALRRNEKWEGREETKGKKGTDGMGEPLRPPEINFWL